MPYKSKKQRAYLHINEPELAARWDKEGGKIVPSKGKPRSKRSKKRANKRQRNGR